MNLHRASTPTSLLFVVVLALPLSLSKLRAGGLDGGLQQAIASSSKLFAAHNFSAGEAMLLASNVHVPGTAAWNVESGVTLYFEALVQKRQGDRLAVQTLARDALAQLSQAEQRFAAGGSPAEIANEREMMGRIYEKLLGDWASAKQCYQSAVAVSPKTGMAAAWLAQLNARLANLGPNER